jgi:hypothetical protein
VIASADVVLLLQHFSLQFGKKSDDARGCFRC